VRDSTGLFAALSPCDGIKRSGQQRQKCGRRRPG